jgi:DNA-directed RNA polymerase subunit H (RpoH/RPB5)
MIELIACPTKDRKGVQGEYVIQLNPKILNKLDKARVGSYFLVGRAHKERTLWTLALLQAVHETISEDEIRIDQTLRTAIGAKEGDKVVIEVIKPIKRGVLGRLLIRILKTQIELMRVKKAIYLDMEKNICRISKDVMKAIGVDEGDFIEVQSPKSSINVRTLELSEEIRKIKEEQIKVNPETYPNCIEMLSLKRLRETEHDLPWIFLDLDARNELAVESCDIVRIHRNVGHTVYKQMYRLSVPSVLTIIGAVIALDITFVLKVVLLLTGLIIAFVFMIIEIRKKIAS